MLELEKPKTTEEEKPAFVAVTKRIQDLCERYYPLIIGLLLTGAFMVSNKALERRLEREIEERAKLFSEKHKQPQAQKTREVIVTSTNEQIEGTKPSPKVASIIQDE